MSVDAAGLVPRRLTRQWFRLLLARQAPRTALAVPLAVLAGAFLAVLARAIHDMRHRLKRANWERLWRRHVDLSVVQACILSTEHLKTLGRVEKRTLFVKPIAEVFRNEYIMARVMETAEKVVASDDPMLVTHLSMEERWHVLNTCTNHLSSCFAPYHVFFNEARRADSYYRSAWYCFTLTCAQTSAPGRWFITPMNPVGKDDVGMLRIRIVLMNEQELRDIASGAIEPPSFGFFTGRHESRWNVCARFADLFARQVRKVSGSDDMRRADWGQNLCGSLAKRKVASGLKLNQMGNSPSSSEDANDNAILRLHIPFPSMSKQEADEPTRSEQCVAKDVVLYDEG
eukprot:CAMPEP_0168411660 /NCGR_PEP_ID=MMETSP0228-20121227/28313_1 /TAXON_ID=133427 /ORGANISM="Protoceratium reticulatum, Strain CCCM 535 (=CCMP 1889)" /LENGTH=342 /DNA_ID=CAMNT_0008425409 /DNA_START=72 /DNA_END=1097 /DNA_ORIENTATION=+